jgi:hypothetical protein
VSLKRRPTQSGGAYAAGWHLRPDEVVFWGRGLGRATAKGATIDRAFYVQVRYPRADRWVTVAVSAVRTVAAKQAGEVYRELRNEAGEAPTQVRIASAELLLREAGEDGALRAATDLWQRSRSV